MSPITAGFFDPLHPRSIAVLGEAGLRYLERLPAAERRALPARLRRRGLRAVVAPPGLRLAGGWRRAGIAVWRSAHPAHETVHALRTLLRRQAERHATVHGVLIAVHGVGVLVEGAPGAGKSALALELVARGHALVADDLVEVTRLAAGVLVGRSPALLRGYLETRGLGVLDVRALHGRAAVRGASRVELVLSLTPRRRALRGLQRLAGRRATLEILGEPVPRIGLPVTAARLPALVEAAALDLRARQAGEGADARLSRRQARALAQARP